MSVVIIDGQGGGAECGVRSDHRILTQASVRSELVTASLLGNAFQVFSQALAITTPNVDHAISWVRNDSPTDNMHVAGIEYSSDAGIVLWKGSANSTGGTIVTDAVPGVSVNMNFTSGKQFPGTNYAGGEGKTITGVPGFVHLRYSSGAQRADLVEAMILGPGNNVGTIVNTSVACNVTVTFACYFFPIGE